MDGTPKHEARDFDLYETNANSFENSLPWDP